MKHQDVSYKFQLVMRGIAILAISLHNLLHWSPLYLRENEFGFSHSRVDQMLLKLSDENFLNLFCNLLSYFGWYGVPTFVLLSGYGLVQKFESKNEPTTSSATYLWKAYTKMIALMIPAIVLYIICDVIFKGGFHSTIPGVLFMCTFLNDILGKTLYITPFWYFGMTLELYALYVCLVKNKGSHTLLCIAFLSLCCLLIYVPSSLRTDLDLTYVRSNLWGWAYVFVFGIWISRKRLLSKFADSHFYNPYWGWILVTVAMPLLILSSFSYVTWILSPLIAILLTTGLAKVIIEIPIINRMFEWIGRISAYIYVFHPAIRLIAIDYLDIDKYVSVVLFLYVLAIVTFSSLYYFASIKVKHYIKVLVK